MQELSITEQAKLDSREFILIKIDYNNEAYRLIYKEESYIIYWLNKQANYTVIHDTVNLKHYQIKFTSLEALLTKIDNDKTQNNFEKIE
jgi:hypothetical protein